MRIVLQRVNQAYVETDEGKIGEIGKGYVLLLGVSDSDTKKHADKMIDKISKLRIFPDENGKSNLSIQDVRGEVLVISQFTLYADCRKGNRPAFIDAGTPEHANKIYKYFVETSKNYFRNVACGSFGADMEVSLINDGPFTVFLDSTDFNIK